MIFLDRQIKVLVGIPDPKTCNHPGGDDCMHPGLVDPSDSCHL